MQKAGFAPQQSRVGREQKRRFHPFKGVIHPFAAQQVTFDIVLQTQQNIPIPQCPVTGRLELGVVADQDLQEAAQVRRADDARTAGGIQDGPNSLVLEPHRKSGRKIQPFDGPAKGVGDVDIKNADPDRQTTAAVDDVHQIGALDHVIDRLVDGIAIALGDDLTQGLGAQV